MIFALMLVLLNGFRGAAFQCISSIVFKSFGHLINLGVGLVIVIPVKYFGACVDADTTADAKILVNTNFQG